MKKILAFAALLLCMFFYINVSTNAAQIKNDYGIIKLNEGWEYISGESPLDSNGIPLWTYDKSVKWEKIKRPFFSLKENNNQNVVWFRIKLPEGNWDNPALGIEGICQEGQIFINKKMIYDSESYKLSNGVYFPFNSLQIVDAPQLSDVEEEYLIFRIRSDIRSFIGIFKDVHIGAKADILLYEVKTQYFEFVLGVIYLILAIVCLGSFAMNKKEKLLLGAGIFLLAVGARAVLISYLYDILLSNKFGFFKTVSMNSFIIMIPVGVIYFLAQITDKTKKIFHYSALIYTAFFIVNIVITLISIPLAYNIYTTVFYYITILICFLAIICISIEVIKYKNINLRAFSIGLIIFISTGIYDMLADISVINRMSRMNMNAIGNIAFVVSILWICLKKYNGTFEKIKVYSKDMEKMAGGLKESINTSHHMFEAIDKTTIKLADMIDKSVEAMRNIAAVSGEISESTGEQIAVASEATGIVGTLSQKTDAIMDKANNMYEYSRGVQDMSQKGHEAIADLKNKNTNSIEHMNRIYEVSRVLNEQIQQINRFTDMIMHIASETKLLSLNASIEAARAGEQGSGFAVVATQVGKLASQSDTKAKEIQNVIKGISAYSKESMERIEEAMGVTKEQDSSVGNTGKIFEELSKTIAGSIDKIGTLFKEIEDIIEIKNTVEKKMKKVYEITERNTSSIEETQATLEGQFEDLNSINEYIQELAKESSTMKDYLKRIDV